MSKESLSHNCIYISLGEIRSLRLFMLNKENEVRKNFQFLYTKKKKSNRR